MKILKNLNKYFLLANLFFLQAYLIRFKIGPYPSNLQEILIGLQVIIFIATIIATKKAFGKRTSEKRAFAKTPSITEIKKETLNESREYGSTDSELTKFTKIKNIILRNQIIISFVVLTLISIAAVPIINTTDFIRHGKFLFFAGVLVFIFMGTFKTGKEKLKALDIMGAGAITFGIFSVVYNLLGHNITHDNRLLGPLDSAVYMAFYITPFFIYFIIRYLEDSKQKLFLFSAIILGILIVGTRSMGAIGGSVAILVFYSLKRQQLQILSTKKAKAILAGLCIIATGAIFYTKILPTIQTSYSSLDERGEIWQTSAQMLKAPKTAVFGAGFGQFQEKYENTVEESIGRPALSYIVLQPHNILLLFWMQYGILGLVFIIYCIIVLAKKITKFKSDSQKHLQTETIVALMLAYLILHGMIDTPFFKNDLMIMLILFMSISLQPNPSKRNKDLPL